MHNNLVFIHYPSGGYGFYLTRLINRYLDGVVKVEDHFDFDDQGTSHSLPLVYHNLHFNAYKEFKISMADIKYHPFITRGDFSLIPCCPGITADFLPDTLNKYPESLFLRLHYDDQSWPLVFYNAIHKAMKGDVNIDIQFDSTMYGSTDNWARRENFSLLCKNHDLRNAWRPVQNSRVFNINILSLITDPGACIKEVATFLNQSYQLSDIKQKHQLFLDSNPGTVKHLNILNLVDNLEKDQSLLQIDELFWQGVFNFYIEKKYQITIPPNSYSNWFTSTGDVVRMLKELGVNIDTN